jgi:UDPglucose 6-dehydrogenase
LQAAPCACLQGADALVLTEWDEFHALDLARNKATLARNKATLAEPVVVDLRNINPAETMRS